jgi:hypothetical protein
MTSLLISTFLVLSAGEERLDHHGAVGLLLGTSGRHQDSNDGFTNGWRQTLDVGASMNVGWASDELQLLARFGFGGQQLGGLYMTSACVGAMVPAASCAKPDGRLRAVDMDLIGGYRGFFGREHFKTLFDLDAAVQLTPFITAGPRIALGVQYDFTSLVGLYATLGAQLGFGQVLEFKAEALVGLQIRSFLLE